MVSVQPEWATHLKLQQQSVLLLAARGPDGVRKFHPCKGVVRAYRGSVLVAAKRGRCLEWGERADSFMSLDRIGSSFAWAEDMRMFFESIDELPHHYLMHLMHGAEILGYKHPDFQFRKAWLPFYFMMSNDMHCKPETEEEMDERLNDWEDRTMEDADEVH